MATKQSISVAKEALLGKSRRRVEGHDYAWATSFCERLRQIRTCSVVESNAIRSTNAGRGRSWDNNKKRVSPIIIIRNDQHINRQRNASYQLMNNNRKRSAIDCKSKAPEIV
jgi:hypothetical protein